MPALDGNLALRAAARGGRTVLVEQAFRAPFHVSKPYWDVASGTLLVQAVNPTAGILTGDRLRLEVEVEEGAALLVTMPSASRVFRMREGEARSEQRLAVAAGGWLEVLPEPLVLHRGSRFRQRTVLEVAAGGAALYADLLVPGRLAHGECWEWERLEMELEVRHGGRLVMRERIEGSGEDLRRLARLAGFATACFGNVVFIAADKVDRQPGWLAEVAGLQQDGTWIGASELPHAVGWSVKMVSPDGIGLRRTLAAVRRLIAADAAHLRCDARKL